MNSLTNSSSHPPYPPRPSFHPPPPPSSTSIISQSPTSQLPSIIPISSSPVTPITLPTPSIPNGSTPSSQAKSPGPSDPETELIQTEESYVNDLRVLVETFVIPLEKWFQSLDFTKPNRQQDYCLETIACEQNINLIDALFANIKVILQCNQLLLDGLHSAERLNKEGAVIESFAKHAPYLKLYSQYTKNCQRATELLTQLRADIRYVTFASSY